MKQGILASGLVAVSLATHGCGDSLAPNVGPTTSGPLSVVETPFTAIVDWSRSNPLNAADCMSVADGTTTLDGCVFFGPITGDVLDGDFSAVLDGTFDALGDGTTRGNLSMAACMVTRCGVFDGRFTGIFEAGVRTDDIDMTGLDGGVTGLTITGILEEQGASPGTDVFDFTGIIRSSSN